jgi:Ser-tRNA(Ala) deacylase AlaX
MAEREISYVTWSAKGIRVVYTGAMVVHLSAEDMYPLAVQAKVISLVDTERRNMVRKAG